MAKCAFIGLGIMGYPMAGHLQARGHDVCVYNRTAQKAEAWASQYGGRTAPTPRQRRHSATAQASSASLEERRRKVWVRSKPRFASAGG